jgi:ubiquitin C-terminal hydrolase
MVYAPRWLIVHLGRFSSPSKGEVTKNDTPVEWPDDLDLSRYLPDSPATGSVTYKINSVCVHYGTVDRGHYKEFLRLSGTEDRWWRCNDDKVKQVTAEKVHKELAYVLFYERNDSS